MNIKERSEFGKITIADLFEALAGIDINGVTVKLNGVEIVDDEEAEQTDIPSEQPVNWFNKLKNKIKNGYERITKKSI